MTRRLIHVLLPSALAVTLASSAHAGYNFNLLVTFTQPNEFSCADVTFGPNGLLYGTTQGNNGFNGLYGTVFSLSPGGGTATPLVNFTGTGTSGTPGGQPMSSLTVGSDGTLYGTTRLGGASNNGTIFSYKPGSNADGSGGTFSTIYSFSNSGDGANPQSVLTLSADGAKLYGTTANTVFSIGTTAGSSPSTLATFSGTSSVSAYGGLTLSNGTLYGTTYNDGANGKGTVFSLSTAANSTPSVLATFNTTNGANPYGKLVLKGNTLYGTTYVGGSSDGTIFSLSSTANNATPTTLVSFTGSTGAYPGLRPYGGLTLGPDGNLYGTTNVGGNGGGTAFSYAPGNGVNGGGGSFTNIYSFSTSANGVRPYGSLTFGPDGNTLYGTTYTGGSGTGYGTVFSLSAAPEPSEWAALAFTGLGIGDLLLRARRRRTHSQ